MRAHAVRPSAAASEPPPQGYDFVYAVLPEVAHFRGRGRTGGVRTGKADPGRITTWHRSREEMAAPRRPPSSQAQAVQAG